MECMSCKEVIDADSIFCDMCGTELSVCAKCRTPIAGKWCAKCGGPKVLASTLVASGSKPQSSSINQGGVVSSVFSQDATASVLHESGTRRVDGAAPIPAATPKLRLRNQPLNVDLTFSESTLIGRQFGPMSRTFGGFDQVSSRHCVLELDPVKGWHVTDLGSTNNTYYNSQQVLANQPLLMSDGGFLRIANIEFFVTIG